MDKNYPEALYVPVANPGFPGGRAAPTYLSFSYLDIFTEFAEFTEFCNAKIVKHSWFLML